MTNNKRFNAMLNNCHHPRAIYAALLALANNGRLDMLRESVEQKHQEEAAT